MGIFLFLIETIFCEPSSEPLHRDGSDEGSQLMFICRTDKIIPNYHQIHVLSSRPLGHMVTLIMQAKCSPLVASVCCTVHYVATLSLYIAVCILY